ncbi:MAG: hypothetical protein AAGA30_15915 [Planctomycetota bacterium]
MKSNANDELLHQNADSQNLLIAVKLFFAMWFVRYLIDPIETLSTVPLDYSIPVGVLQFTSPDFYQSLHSFWGLLILKVGICSCAISVWFPRIRNVAAIVGCVLLMIVNAVTRGFGHLNHAEIGPLLVTCILVAFMCQLKHGEYRSAEASKTASSGLILATLCFMLTYSFVGVARLIHGGIAFFSGETITNSMLRMSQQDWLLEIDLSSALVANSGLLFGLKIGTAIVTIFEAAAPLVLVSRLFRTSFLLLIPGFHLGAILIFKIDFVENIFAMVALLYVIPCLLESDHWLPACISQIKRLRLSQNKMAVGR